MKATLQLTPDQLADLVCHVLAVNGYDAFGLELLGTEGERVGFANVVVHYNASKALEVYPKPQISLTRQQINDMLYPNGVGIGQLNGAGAGA